MRVQTAYILLGKNSSMSLHNFTPLGLDTTTMHSCTLRLSLHPTRKPPTALRTLRDGQAQLRKRCVSLTGCSAPLGAGGSAPPVRQGFVARCKWRREGINVQRRDKPRQQLVHALTTGQEDHTHTKFEPCAAAVSTSRIRRCWPMRYLPLLPPRRCEPPTTPG